MGSQDPRVRRECVRLGRGRAHQANRGVCRWVASSGTVGSGAQSAPQQVEPGAAGLPADRIAGGAAAAERRWRRLAHAALDADVHESVRRPERPDGQPGRRSSSTSTRLRRGRRQRRQPRSPVPAGSSSRTAWSGVQLKSLGGDFSQFVSQLTERGHAGHDLELRTTAWSTAGSPVNELPTIAELAQTQSGQANYDADRLRSEYQGVAYNEAETSTVRRRRADRSSASTAPA